MSVPTIGLTHHSDDTLADGLEMTLFCGGTTVQTSRIMRSNFNHLNVLLGRVLLTVFVVNLEFTLSRMQK